MGGRLTEESAKREAENDGQIASRLVACRILDLQSPMRRLQI
jgi:hypothetical protein